jgi:hypothetical protein
MSSSPRKLVVIAYVSSNNSEKDIIEEALWGTLCANVAEIVSLPEYQSIVPIVVTGD